ncbi:hypothetical protein BpHYR1_047189 [Brachionus plicatilis]|uniref:Uncharacterized protein n=1 Tax=Brachionus plicatilis TaxID=10195 RepID=A0A3M7PHH0_BRAPC|nr:hypothetical protein BpHYR1_047189 [Brachionus plicatilis]
MTQHYVVNENGSFLTQAKNMVKNYQFQLPTLQFFAGSKMTHYRLQQSEFLAKIEQNDCN